jgi:AbrB family looped-hinge helix DNA binding protein
MPAMLVPVGERGRVVLPASIREALGIREGDRLVAEALPDGTLRLVPLRKIAQMAKGLLADLRPAESWTDELLAERREEAVREEREDRP